MCLLHIAEPNKAPTYEQLKCACSNNPDGFGYAVHTGDSIITGRGLDYDSVIRRFLNVRERYSDGFAMFHARLATHGSVNKNNCHPFRVGGSDKIILGHNGILPVDISKGDNRSDTKIFADELLPKAGIESLDDESYFDELEKWAGGSKIAILNASPKLDYELYIVNEQLGDWEKGLWWSNGSYKYDYTRWSWLPSRKTKSDGDGTSVASVYDEDDFDSALDLTLCYECGATFTEMAMITGVCETCDTCIECYTHTDSCLCYQGSASSRDAIWKESTF